jgi:1,4-alpha-glucan branching enzyme
MADEHRPGMGALPHEEGVAFRVWAPHADAVFVAGDFNEWSIDADELADEGNGYWYADVAQARPGQQYKYALKVGDSVIHRVDPHARAVTNSVGNGIIYDPDAFDWQGDSFECPPHNELVVYETHIGSFVATEGDPGDFHDGASRLGYLRTLGINAIELMPVMEFAGDYSWGYNPAHVFAVESTYGGPDALKAFVREAHRDGIAVILDVVYNHFGPSDLDLWQFDGWSENGKGGIYFYQDWRSETPWGDTRPDYGRDDVRRFILDNVRMWLDEYHVDGLRFDSTLHIRSADGHTTDIPDGWGLMQWVTDEVRKSHPHAILIAEDLQGDPALTEPTPGGAGFHAQWDAGFVHPVRAALVTPDDGERSMPEIAAAVLGGDDTFARVIYTESHDEVANGKARVPQEVDPGDPTGWAAQKRATLGMALTLTSPGIPMLFQGQEFLEDEWFQDTVPLDWDRAQAFRDVVRMVQDLVRLRRDLDGDSAGLLGPQTRLLDVDDEANVLAFVRSADEGQDVVVVANFAASAATGRIAMPYAAHWRLRFNSDARTYSALFGDHHSADLEAEEAPMGEFPASAKVDVGPYSLVVYTAG